MRNGTLRLAHLAAPRWIGVLKSGYAYDDVLKDLLAGLSVSIIALPLSMAIAIASGATPAQGIYAAVLGGFVASFLGGSRFQIAGPSGTLVVVSYGIIASRGFPALASATLAAGLLLIVLGFSGFGRIIKYIPYPVTTGFTAGIGILIFSQQIKDFAGLPIRNLPPDFLSQWGLYLRTLRDISIPSAAVGALTIALMLLCRKLAPRLPSAITALGLSLLAVRLFGLPVETIESRFGELPSGIPVPTLPSLSGILSMELWADAFTIAVLVAIESLLSAVVGDGMTGDRHNSNMELVAQGAANVAGSFFGGVPTTAALARTAVNIKSGARSPFAGMAHAAILALFVVVLAPFASSLPLASLAGVLMLVAWDMSDLGRVVRLVRRFPRSDTAVLAVTLVLSLAVGITMAVKVGVALAAALFLKRMIEVSGISVDTESWDRAGAAGSLPEHHRDVEIFEINGPFFFGVADVLHDTLNGIERNPRVFILRMLQVPAIDSTGIAALESFLVHCRRRRTRLYLCEVQDQPRRALERVGFLEELGSDKCPGTLDEALRLAAQSS